MARRLAAVRAHGLPWLVAEVDGRVVGYAAADRWKARSAYRFAVETSVYLEPQATGRGIGTALCTELLDRLRASPAHAVISGIALPNPASVRLHERLGMRRVATFSQVGFKLGRWVDVAYWQTIFDRNEAGGAPGAPPEKATDSTVSDYGFEP